MSFDGFFRTKLVKCAIGSLKNGDMGCSRKALEITSKTLLHVVFHLYQN